MKVLSTSFWQQQLVGVNFASWFVKRRVAAACSVISGSLHLIFGILYLSLMHSAWEVQTGVFSDPAGQTVFEIEVPTDSARVALYVAIPTFFSNYRVFSMSRDPRIIGAPFQSTRCGKGEQTLDDFMRIRGDKFQEFMTDHPLLNPSALSGNGTAQLCPCGLNSFSLLLDMFELRSDTQVMQLDETRIARSSDIDFVKSNKLKTNANDGISGVFNGETGDIKFNDTTCWLRGNTGTTPTHQQDRAFLRLLSFYRTSTSSYVTLLLGHYDNLKQGKYTLTAIKIDPSWNQWSGAKQRRVIISGLSSVGTNDPFVPILCIVLGVIQCVFGVIFKFVKPKEV